MHVILLCKKNFYDMKNLTKTFKISTGKQYFFSTILLFIFITILYNVQNTIGYETVSLILLLIIFLLPIFSFSRGPIIISAIISALAWDYYFIPPHFTMKIDKTEDGVMLFLFFIVAVANGVLTAKLEEQKNKMIERDRRLNAFYNLLKDLLNTKDLDQVLTKFLKQIQNIFGFESVIFFPENQNKLKREPHTANNFSPDEMEWLAAEASFKSKEETGKTTNTLHDAEAIYFPLQIKGSVFCVIGVKINDQIKSDSIELEFLRSFIKEITPFLETYSSYSNP